MIGRRNSNPIHHPDGAGRSSGRSVLIAVALASVVGFVSAVAPGPMAQAQAQQQPQRAPAPKAKIKTVVPTEAPAPPRDEPEPLPAPDPVPQAPGGITLSKDANEPPPPARRDAQVVPTEGDDANPLGPAKDRPGGGGSGAAKGPANDPDGFALPVERMTTGRQRVQLSVEVQASPVINKDKESTVRIVIVNEGLVDAYGVSVIYQLPDGLEFVSATPAPTQVPGDKSLYYFKKPMLSTNNQWIIPIKVVAREVRSAIEHAATVTAKAGSRANATVQEPKLKVEVTAAPTRVLKGEQVKFVIAVTNPGSGPARNVTVQARLSGGLKLGADDLVAQTIDVVRPGERVPLEELQVSSVAGGQQTCTVEVRSDDVVLVPDDHRVVRTVEVTKPELKLDLAGEESRYTGQAIEYKLTVSNPGTAPAKKVKVLASLPAQGGHYQKGSASNGGQLIMPSRKLGWLLDQVEPGQSIDLSFVYETGPPGLYRLAVEAVSGQLHPTNQMSTDVSGIATLDVQVQQDQSTRYIDVGKKTYYKITIKNSGTKEATRVQLSAQLSENLKLINLYDVAKVDYNAPKGQIVFPEFDRLAPGQQIELGIEVEATKAGPGKCQVAVAHADQAPDEAKVEDTETTNVTDPKRPRVAPASSPK